MLTEQQIVDVVESKGGKALEAFDAALNTCDTTEELLRLLAGINMRLLLGLKRGHDDTNQGTS